MDINYNNQNVVVADFQSELTKLRLKNHAFQLLLKEHIKKNTLLNDKDDTEVSSTRREIPPKHNTTPPAPVVPTHAHTHTKGRIAEKAKAVQILTSKVSVIS